MKLRTVFYVLVGFALLGVFFAIALTWGNAKEEQLSLESDLRYRTRLLADSLNESIEPYYLVNSRDSIQKIVDKFTNRERLVGLVIYDSKGIKIASSLGLSPQIIEEKKTATLALDTNQISDNFLDIEKNRIYVVVYPLHQTDKVVGAFMVVQDANYISASVVKIWKGDLIKAVVEIILFFSLVYLIIWWAIYKPIRKIVELVKSARNGKSSDTENDFADNIFFRPLINEISKMVHTLVQARSTASEEARLRLEKIDTPWTAERLKEFIKAYLKNRPIFVVSNREPYIHQRIKNEIKLSVVPSGMNTAVNSVMEACGGMWIAYGSGSADKEMSDEHGKIRVPPDDPKYTLKRIWLNEKESKGYYSFSVEAMYPLCLMTYNRPIFNKEDWLMYKKVNGKFAENILEELRGIDRPIILIQDYHFAILARMIKKSRPDAQIALFWHVPWQSAEAFSVCPWRKEILYGMLGADVIGFNTQQFCNNFIDTVGKEIESLVNFEQFSITKDEHTTYIRSFPISIAFTDNKDGVEEKKPDRDILRKLGIKTKYFALGVDRLDYVKGIPERFKGIEYLLEKYPEYVSNFTFLQIAPQHRQEMKKYQEYKQIVIDEAERINKKFSTRDWKPIVLEIEQYGHEKIDPLYKLADACVITSLHDSMNLVAKEYVAARNDELGALVLSQFAGASRDLKGAIIVNPHNVDEIGEAIHQALIMSPLDQTRRMKKMRDIVKNYNVYRWAAEIIKAVSELV